jgi:hypothetical protein
MAKYKPASGKKPSAKAKSIRSAIPCFLLIILGIAMMTLLFLLILKK